MTYAQRLAAQLKQAEKQAKVYNQQKVDNSKCVWQHVGKHHQ